jgi:excisionase family DNA binding protein
VAKEKPVEPWLNDFNDDPEMILMTPGEVAQLLRVNPKTVTRWAIANKLTCIRTPGGHRRYRITEVMKILDG